MLDTYTHIILNGIVLCNASLHEFWWRAVITFDIQYAINEYLDVVTHKSCFYVR